MLVTVKLTLVFKDVWSKGRQQCFESVGFDHEQQWLVRFFVKVLFIYIEIAQRL